LLIANFIFYSIFFCNNNNNNNIAKRRPSWGNSPPPQKKKKSGDGDYVDVNTKYLLVTCICIQYRDIMPCFFRIKSEASAKHYSALEVSHCMRYINSRLTLITYLHGIGSSVFFRTWARSPSNPPNSAGKIDSKHCHWLYV